MSKEITIDVVVILILYVHTLGSLFNAQSLYLQTRSRLGQKVRKSTMYSYRSGRVESCSSPSATRIHNYTTIHKIHFILPRPQLVHNCLLLGELRYTCRAAESWPLQRYRRPRAKYLRRDEIFCIWRKTERENHEEHIKGKAMSTNTD